MSFAIALPEWSLGGERTGHRGKSSLLRSLASLAERVSRDWLTVVRRTDVGLFRHKPRWQDYWTVETHGRPVEEVFRGDTLRKLQQQGLNFIWSWKVTWTDGESLRDTQNIVRALSDHPERWAGDLEPVVWDATAGLPGLNEVGEWYNNKDTPDWRATEQEARTGGETIAGILWHLARYDQ